MSFQIIFNYPTLFGNDPTLSFILQLSKKCYDWLAEKPRTQWTRSAYGMTPKSDQFVNNQCEVFNNSIGKHRDLPILSMLQAIHIDVMTRIQKKKEQNDS